MLHEKMTKKEVILRLHYTGMKQVVIAKEVNTYQQYVNRVIRENKAK